MEVNRHWRRKLSGLILVALSSIHASVSHAADQFSQDALKAAYLYRFPGYVEWPGTPSTETFTIAVLGASGVANELARMLVAQPIKTRTARVQSVGSIADVKNAEVLFIGSGHSSSELRKLIAPVASRPILIVTDDLHGLAMGSAINFSLVDRRVRFEVSLDAAKRAGLSISSELLSVAVKVSGERGPDAPCSDDKPAQAPCGKSVVSR